MERRRIAIVCGGYTSEKEVSLKSADGLYSFINKDLYDVKIVVITKSEGWYVKDDNGIKIPVDKNDFTYNGGKGTFDYAWITIHGDPGENGLLQGYFDMINIPYSCCGVLAASLTFNKYFCNVLLKSFGINVADSILLRKGCRISAEEIEKQLGLPCFVKSNVGGSSFGVTKVKKSNQIQSAVEKAFKEGDEVIIESFLDGTEVTSGCYKTKEKTVKLPLTEVVTRNEFFDYDAKYNGQVKEITPAGIPDKVRDEIQNNTSRIYDLIGCKGIIRADYIITKKGIYLLEVNTTPGMTATSFIPQEVSAAGMKMSDVMSDIIENDFKK